MCAMRTIASDVHRDRNQVAALANGMRAIEAFAASRQRMTLAEVAKHSGLTRAAARRYLLTLVASGYADFDGKRFQLTSRVLRLGHAYISSVSLPRSRSRLSRNSATGPMNRSRSRCWKETNP
jgi:DNA-binding IclR family transcriptional regulator